MERVNGDGVAFRDGKNRAEISYGYANYQYIKAIN